MVTFAAEKSSSVSILRTRATWVFRSARIVPPKSHRCVACDAHISTNLDSAIEAEIAEAQQNLRDAADCCARGEGIEALACITTALQSWAVARDHLKGYPE